MYDPHTGEWHDSGFIILLKWIFGTIVGWFVLVTLIIIGLGFTWIGEGNDFFLYQYFAPKYQQVQREVFEQSKSYNQGMIQNLQSQQFDYAKADKDGKAALGSIILHETADYDETKLPPDLRDFVDGLKRQKALGQ